VIPDERLALLYTCAHPAIDPALHPALLLQVVLGLDAARLASAFVVAPATLGQRLSRAKAKLRDAGVRFAVPAGAGLAERTRSVLDAVYAAYGTGWDDAEGADQKRRGLQAEAERLGRLVVELQPASAEARGLLALMLHVSARAGARVRDAMIVPLDRQDTRSWSPALIAEADAVLGDAASLGHLGPYQLQAAIQSVHNRRASTGTTDWMALAALYDGLLTVGPSLGARVARAAAHARVDGPRQGLALLDELDPERVHAYQPYWATRAHLLRSAGSAAAEVGAAARHAIGLTGDPPTRRYLLAEFGDLTG
jgi:RNA polymerase sigma-70 factor (ECF subfamily)